MSIDTCKNIKDLKNRSVNQYYRDMTDYIATKGHSYTTLKNLTNNVTSTFYNSGITSTTQDLETQIAAALTAYQQISQPVLQNQFNTNCCTNDNFLYNPSTQTCLDYNTSVQNFAGFVGIISNGHQYKVINTTVDDCITRCSNDSGCLEFNYDITNGACGLIDQLNGYQPYENFTLYRGLTSPTSTPTSTPTTSASTGGSGNTGTVSTPDLTIVYAILGVLGAIMLFMFIYFGWRRNK
jgi:uncharacterized protein (DUF2164 family)